MLKTKNWIYLDLEKTGCTFLRNKLLSIYPEKIFEEKTKHSLQVNRVSSPKIITIREPEAYYFSLWSYGIDHKGGFFNSIKLYYPEKLNIFYGKKTKDCFSYFLDFVLNHPFRYPNNNFSKYNLKKRLITKLNFSLSNIFKNYTNNLDKFVDTNSWIPKSSDVYTARILSMLIPRNDVINFSAKLKTDLSYQNLKNNLVNYLPEIILRTSTLNSDFYEYYNNRKLDFLNLPIGWQNIFPLNSIPINKSKLSSSKSFDFNIDNYLSIYHRELLKSKSNLSFLLLDKAKADLSK